MVSKAILTSFQANSRSGLGIAHTLRDRIYAYIFGERMGAVQIGGIAFAGVCDVTSLWTGFDGVYSYYERVRSSTQGTPVRLVLGPATVLLGFMSEFNFVLEDANTGVGSFSFMFKTMPRNVEFGFLPPLQWEGLTGENNVFTPSLTAGGTSGGTISTLTGTGTTGGTTTQTLTGTGSLFPQ